MAGWRHASIPPSREAKPGRHYIRSALNGLARPYRVNRHLSIVWVYFTSSKGAITGDEGRAQVERLPSFAGWFGRPAIGQQVNSESEEESRAGYLYLLNDDPGELDRDEAVAIDRIWSDALFTVA